MPKTCQNSVVLMPKNGVILGLKMMNLGFKGPKNERKQKIRRVSEKFSSMNVLCKTPKDWEIL
jgi:hypothetical protein